MEESKVLCRILIFFRKERFASCPSVCQAESSSEKSELHGKCSVNFTGENVDTPEQRLACINAREHNPLLS